MTLHKHWSAPAQAEVSEMKRSDETAAPTPVPAAVPALTHVYIGQRLYNGDTTTKVFVTREACVAWKESLQDDYEDFNIFHREIRY